MSKCSSVMSHSKPQSVQPAPEADSKREAVDDASACSSVAASAASSHTRKSHATTTTTCIQRQLESLEEELNKERDERLKAQNELRRTAKELEAIERLLSLRK